MGPIGPCGPIGPIGPMGPCGPILPARVYWTITTSPAVNAPTPETYVKPTL